MEISMEIPHETTNRNSIQLSYSLLEELKLYYSDLGILMFIAAQLTTPKPWKWPMCPSTDGRMKTEWYLHTRKLRSATK